MSTLEGLPNVSSGAIQMMQKGAEEMMQQDGIVIEQEQIPVEIETQEQESSVEVEQEQQPSPQPAAKTSEQAERFKQVREAKEKAERERDEYLRIIRQIEAQKNAPQQQPPEDLEFKVNEDDLLDGKHGNLLQRQNKSLKQQQEEMRKELENIKMLNHLKEIYKDYSYVMTNENINKLEEQEPEIGALLRSSQDPYAARASAYKFIKSFNIYQDSSSNEKERTLANHIKPKSLASVSTQTGNNPLARANAFDQGLTAELSKALLAEMTASRRKM